MWRGCGRAFKFKKARPENFSHPGAWPIVRKEGHALREHEHPIGSRMMRGKKPLRHKDF
jgi:hypothetical protein